MQNMITFSLRIHRSFRSFSTCTYTLHQSCSGLFRN